MQKNRKQQQKTLFIHIVPLLSKYAGTVFQKHNPHHSLAKDNYNDHNWMIPT